MSTIDTDPRGVNAALAAAEAFVQAFRLLNMTDVPAEGEPTGRYGQSVALTERLSVQAPGTPYQLAVDGLLGTLDALLGKGRAYSERVYEATLDGESVAWCIEHIAREDVARAAAARCCDYCDQPATHVNTEASEILCTACTIDQYTPEYRKDHLRPLTDAVLVRLGRVTA